MHQILLDENSKKLLSDSNSLYNFMTSKVLVEKILHKGRLRFQNLMETNDPYEYTNLNIRSYSYPNKITQKDEIFCEEMAREIQRLRKNMCVGCFCCNEDKSVSYSNLEEGEYYNARLGYQHSRMWSQYGENHKGACIVVNKTLLINELEPRVEHDLLFAEKIKYVQDQIIVFGYEDLLSFKGMDPKEAAVEYFKNDKYRKKLLFTKDIDYDRENEFRIAFYSKNRYEFIENHVMTAIILGHEFPEKKEQVVSEASRDLEIPVFKAHFTGNVISLFPIK